MQEKNRVLLFWSADPNKELEPEAAVLSNFARYPSLGYPTSEHAYMAFKALFFGDLASLHRMRDAKTPREAKNIGSEVANFNDKLWDPVKEDFMFRAVYDKFKGDHYLTEYLISTHTRRIAEASPYDLVWGIGLSKHDPLAQNPDNWRGQNLLGKILENVRAHLIIDKYSI